MKRGRSKRSEGEEDVNNDDHKHTSTCWCRVEQHRTDESEKEKKGWKKPKYKLASSFHLVADLFQFVEKV